MSSNQFYSRSDGSLHIGFAAPFFDEDDHPIGVVLGTTLARSTFGAVQMNCTGDGDCMTALLGSRDRDGPAEDLPDAVNIVAEPGLSDGQDRLLDRGTSRRICGALDCTPRLRNQFTLTSRAQALILDNYVDPVSHARSIAALAPVGGTGLVVLVATPDSAADALTHRMIDRMKSFLWIPIASSSTFSPQAARSLRTGHLVAGTPGPQLVMPIRGGRSGVTIVLGWQRARSRTRGLARVRVKTCATGRMEGGVYIDSSNLEFGAWPLAAAGAAKVKFTLFFPNNTQYTTQKFDNYGKGPTYGDPQIASIWVIGAFQSASGQTPGSTAAANAMAAAPHPSGKGTVWTLTTSVALAQGFYDYQYVVEFDDGSRRTATDPCARWGGSSPDRSGLVVGASPIAGPVHDVRGSRLAYRDLIVYELNIDDYTAELPGLAPPIEKVRAKIPDLVNLGVNAVEFLPWTAWADDNYGWGYTPGSFFSVEHRYTHNVLVNEDTIQRSRLQRLISELHDAGIHVIMDGVFNHAGGGFAYPQFYLNPADCPYMGTFGGAFSGLPDLDYHNACTQELVQDVCFYWMDEFGIDGIRYDAALYYYQKGTSQGIAALTSAVAAHAVTLDPTAGPRFAQILEFLDVSAATVTTGLAAGSYWRESLYQDCFNGLWSYTLPSRIMASLDAKAYLGAPDKVATTYLSNHDHSQVAWQAGAAHNQGSMEWYRMQPYAIALLVSPGTPLIPNGQEFAADPWIMENDQGTSRRVVPRSLHWGYPNDSIGSALSAIYRRLVALRKAHPALRSDDIYPAGWPENQGTFNAQGYGVDSARQLLIFHRWGPAPGGGVDRVIVALNFSDYDQQVDIPFPADGLWVDQLSSPAVSPTVSGFWLRGWTIPRYWGFVFLNTAVLP